MQTELGSHFAPLLEPAVYHYFDTESGKIRTRRLEAGRLVLVKGVKKDKTLYVDGIARPTMRGGGIHAMNAVDPETGERISPSPIITGAYVYRG